ncbi:F-box protein [Panicum miliaceum]|uniref:F-box protein n=1 Tax=Panicum miliaceum TaxID=4540 RepID=A0A3L6TBU1_PANMI|nr:F-box protein [Panicum miliaceum]
MEGAEGSEAGDAGGREPGVTCTSARLALDPPPAAGAGAQPSYRIFEFQSDLVTMSVRSPAVWIYSSETGAWTHRECGWANGDGVTLRDESSGVYHRGRLHLCPMEPVIASVDRDGRRWITTPKPSDPRDDGFLGGPPPGHIGVSRGRVQFLNTPEYNHLKMCVWERDTGRWVPKHSIDLRELFVTWDHRLGLNCRVLGVHPDRGVVYFLQGQRSKLVPCDMEHGDQGSVICDPPYVLYAPSFARSFQACLCRARAVSVSAVRGLRTEACQVRVVSASASWRTLTARPG